MGRTTIAQVVTLATDKGARQIHAAVEPTNTASSPSSAQPASPN
ncbi:hypothetical protein [Kribbella sp. VKM Ac-2568]